jgi:hypothetical protein
VGLANVFSGLTGGYTGKDPAAGAVLWQPRQPCVWACTLCALGLTVLRKQ